MKISFYTLFITFLLSQSILLAQKNINQNDMNQTNSSENIDVDKKSKIYTFLTFQKEDAEEAMNFYTSLFDNSEILKIDRWGPQMPGKEGTVMHAVFKLGDSYFMCSDSPPVHEWDFTPAVSSFVECESEEEVDSLFEQLSKDGQVTMPLGNYGFSKKFGWVIDRFGVSWQLNLSN